MATRPKHFVRSQQLNAELITSLFRDADLFRAHPTVCSGALTGKVLATFFQEESTRTRLSFEAAMMRLGGSVISTANAQFSSMAKGESLEDTIMVLSGYADGIVLRHSKTGAAKRAAAVSDVPIINAGDGKGQHPTQALLDVYTIQRELGRLEDFRIAFVGDLASGRTARSLCYLLGKFDSDIRITFISPENLRMRNDIKEYLTRHGVRFVEKTNLNHVLPKVDIVYMTRIQKERISPEDYEKARGKYVLNMENLGLVRPNARIMHPLPHVEEIDLPVKVVKSDPRIAYIRQAHNGMYVRMALLNHMLRD